MNRAEILALLSRYKPEMQRRFGMRSLALFGSRAREQPHAKSDFDVLVEFDGPATSARYFGPCSSFSRTCWVGGLVDLFTEQALRPQLRRFVERDLMHV